MALVKARHIQLFKELTTELLEDLGKSVYIHRPTTSSECAWCYYDPASKSSSGVARTGKIWSTHPNYQGSSIRCPECLGRGLVNQPDIITVSDVVVQDLAEGVWEYGKFFSYPKGSKRIIGPVLGVLKDSSDLNSGTKFDGCEKVVIDSLDYIVVSVNILGLRDNHIFDVIIKRTTNVDTTPSGELQN